MEELLKEILAELKKLNSGIIMSADDMLALLERNKQITDDRTRSVYRESFEMYKAANKNSDKKSSDTDLTAKLFHKVGRSEFMQLGDAFIRLSEVRCIDINSKGQVTVRFVDNTSFAGFCTASEIVKEPL